MSQPNGNGRLRIALDATFILALLSLAYWIGGQAQQIDDLQEATRTPGRVQISIEARERLTKLESKVIELERRINTMESHE